MATNYFVRLRSFEGPLDLLLHLIKVNELDIFDIDLIALTTQYLDYLRLIEFRDIKDAATFLGMASSLIEIKSRQLLPNQGADLSEEGDADGNESTLESLQKRLIEYDMIQQAGGYLASLTHGNKLLISPKEHIRLEAEYGEHCKEVRGETSVLLILYEQMLSTLSERIPTKITASGEKITISEAMERLRQMVEKMRLLCFQKSFSQFQSRYELVAHIMAVLQLVRESQINIYQEDLSGPIWLSHKENTDDAAATLIQKANAEESPSLDRSSH